MQLAQLKKIINFYGRCAASFSQIGFVARGLPWRSFDADFSEQLWLAAGATLAGVLLHGLLRIVRRKN